jgi:uncharacterized protein YyaL (SSP411 family)
MGWSMDEFEDKIATINQKLLDERSHRVRPGTDDKCLTSWNAMVLAGLCDAYAAFGDEEYLFLALKNARWIRDHQLQNDGTLWRNYKNGRSTIDGFLEDYAHVIQAFSSLYQVTFDVEWMELANKLNEFTLTHFQDEVSKMFFFTAEDTRLIARKMELNDNVIPASNSVMANNLFLLSNIYYRKDLRQLAEQMLANMYEGMEMYGSGYSNWGELLLKLTDTSYQVVVLGNDSKRVTQELHKHYLPHVVYAGGRDLSLPVTADKTIPQETTIFICYEGTCLMPTTDVSEVLKQIMH